VTFDFCLSTPPQILGETLKNVTGANITSVPYRGGAQAVTDTRQATQGHMTLQDIGTMATRAKVKTVVLSHLSARAGGSDDYTPWAAEVKKYFSGEVLVAKDLMTF
jgi:phosphoribosyl 1,2-cyclic phosphodiesterase